jgi:hypothetical protein
LCASAPEKCNYLRARKIGAKFCILGSAKKKDAKGFI